MSEEEASVESRLEAVMLEYLRSRYEGIALVTGWVLVTEIMDSNGEPNLAGFAMPGMPYWKISGLLDYAEDVMEYEDESEEIDAEDD